MKTGWGPRALCHVFSMIRCCWSRTALGERGGAGRAMGEGRGGGSRIWEAAWWPWYSNCCHRYSHSKWGNEIPDCTRAGFCLSRGRGSRGWGEAPLPRSE